MSDSKVRIIIYDKSDNDSLVCAALLKYYLIHDAGDDCVDESLIKAYNWDEQPITLNMIAVTIASEVHSISLCASIVDADLIKLMYEALGEKLMSVQFSPLYNQRVTDYTVAASRLHKLIPPRNELANQSVFNVAQSATLTLFQYLYGESATVNSFFEYMDAFTCDRYYDYPGMSRDEVIAFDKALSWEAGADFDNIYDIVCDVMEKGDSYDMNHWTQGGADEDIDNEIELLIAKFASDGYTINSNRSAFMIETPERLTEFLLTQCGYEETYDSIITIWRMKPGYWKVGIYNLYHPTDDIVISDNNVISMDDRVILEKNGFVAGEYMYLNYGGYGNDLYGVAEMSDNQMLNILKGKKFK